jgi:2-methylaconitate cis-trans-isomerase PrpF
VFVAAEALGLRGNESPDEIESARDVLCVLASIREAASVAMRIAPDLRAARAISAIPYIGFVAAPIDTVVLGGASVDANAMDASVRMMSNGQVHRALPLTAALCTAVASRIEGTIVHRALQSRRSVGPLRLGTPSGVIDVDADVSRDGGWIAKYGSFYRTARRLFDGHVYAPTA